MQTRQVLINTPAGAQVARNAGLFPQSICSVECFIISFACSTRKEP